MSAEWVAQALKFSGISQARLSRELAAKIPGRRPGRDVINKIIHNRQQLKADEMRAISEITGYPLVREPGSNLGGSTHMRPMPSHMIGVPGTASGSSPRTVGTFDEQTLFEALRAAFVAAGTPLDVAERLSRGWIESARIRPTDQHSPDHPIP